MKNTADYLLDKYGLTMTPNDVGEVLHSHPSHVRALCQTGELPAFRLGERWHISTAKLAEIIDGEPWFSTIAHEVECRECGTIYDYDTAKDMPCCPKCHGQE